MPAADRIQARLRRSRTLAGPRWGEYRRLLAEALERGYEAKSLEDWLEDPGRGGRPVLLLRHDVDQHPRSALTMATIEGELGLRSTWYVRWRTADPRVIDRLRDAGGAVGLHYETLSRRVLERNLAPHDVDAALVADCRSELEREVAAFRERFGAVRSICPHGDSRVPFVDNVVLVRDHGAASVGVRWDARADMAGRGLRFWLTDRSPARGGWGDGADPSALFRDGVGPILCVTHPHHWVSGGSVWGDRLLGAALRTLRAPRAVAPPASGTDRPPLAHG